MNSLTAAAPGQARAPKGTRVGGQWIDTPSAILRSLSRLEKGKDFGSEMAPEDVMRAERRRLAAEILDREGRTSLEDTAQRLSDIYDLTTPEQRAAGEVWYEDANDVAAQMVVDSGGTMSMEQAAAVLAKTSPLTLWDANVIIARTIAQGGSYEDARAAVQAAKVNDGLNPKAYVLESNVKQAIKALASDDPIGRNDLGTFSEGANKTRTFASNILGDQDGVTVDTWMYRLMGQSPDVVADKALGTKTKRVDQTYEALGESVRVAAERAGITPAQMQAAIWGWGLANYSRASDDAPGYFTDPTTGRVFEALPSIGRTASAAPDLSDLSTSPPDYFYAQAENLLGLESPERYDALDNPEAPMPDTTRSRFAEPPVFQVVGQAVPATVNEVIPAVTAAIGGGGPKQARAPKGSSGGIGGQWIDAVSKMIDQVAGWVGGGDKGPVDDSNGQLVGQREPGYTMDRPAMGPDEIANMHASGITGQWISEDGDWLPERRALHEEIINEFLDGVPSQPDGEAIAYFNGGGPGSGKGSFTNGVVDAGYPSTRAIDDMTGAPKKPANPTPGAVLIDPDSIKMRLPETRAWREMQNKHGDTANKDAEGGNWADQSHEESSYLAKMLFAEAMKRNVNIVYDGTGMKIVGKAKEALSNGYKEAQANYMYVEADQALSSAIERAGRIGRNVPATVLSGQYEEMPKKFTDTATAAESGVFSQVNAYDRNGVQKGQQIPKIFEVVNGKRKILDQAAYDRFMSSGDRVPDVGQ